MPLDLLELLRSIRPQPYDNNLPSGGAAPVYPPASTAPRVSEQDLQDAAIADQQGDVTALEAADYPHDVPVEDVMQRVDAQGDDPSKPYVGRFGRTVTDLMRRREAARADLEARSNNPNALDARLARAYRRRFGGTTPGSPDFMARLTGEQKPADPNATYEDTELRAHTVRPTLPGAVAAYEDTEFRRGVPPAPGALPPPDKNPRDVGGVPGDTRKLSDEEILQVLLSQLNDPDRDMTADAELRGEIARQRAKIAANGALPKVAGKPAADRDYGYGRREDGTQKGLGFFGELKRPDGDFSTELSFDTEVDGKKISAPLLVPTLTRAEIDHLLSGGKPTAAIYDKATRFALARIKAGKSPFASEGEQVPLPDAVPEEGGGALGDADQDLGAQPDQDADGASTAGALENVGPSSGAAAASPVAGEGQAPAAPRRSLGDTYRTRVADAEAKLGRGLSDDEKKNLQLDFFLRLMAAGGRRGGNLATNAAEAGLGTMGEYTKAQERRAKLLREAREDAYREVGLEDKDRDNQRADRLDRERMNLLRDQLNQGRYEVKTGGRGGNFVIFDRRTKTLTDTGIKASDSVNSTRPAAIQLYEYLNDHPEAREDVLRLMKVDQGEKDEAKLLELAGKLRASDLTGRMTGQEAVRQAREMLDAVRGQQGDGGSQGALPSFKTPADLEAARKAGKVKRGDRVLTPEGERIVR